MCADIDPNDGDVNEAVESTGLWLCHKLRKAEETVDQQQGRHFVENLHAISEWCFHGPPMENVARCDERADYEGDQLSDQNIPPENHAEDEDGSSEKEESWTQQRDCSVSTVFVTSLFHEDPVFLHKSSVTELIVVASVHESQQEQ